MKKSLLSALGLLTAFGFIKNTVSFIEAECFDRRVKSDIKDDIFNTLLNGDVVMLSAIDVADNILSTDVLKDVENEILVELILSGITRNCANQIQEKTGCEINQAVMPEFRNMLINSEVKEYVENRVANRDR